MKFTVNGIEKEFELREDWRGNLALFDGKTYICGVTSEGMLTQYVLYAKDEYKVKENGRIKVDKSIR